MGVRQNEFVLFCQINHLGKMRELNYKNQNHLSDPCWVFTTCCAWSILMILLGMPWEVGVTVPILQMRELRLQNVCILVKATHQVTKDLGFRSR